MSADPMVTASFSPMDPLSFRIGARAVWLDDATRIRDEAVADACGDIDARLQDAFTRGAAHAIAQVADALGPEDLDPVERIGETEDGDQPAECPGCGHDMWTESCGCVGADL